jgi:hypothetical protein
VGSPNPGVDGALVVGEACEPGSIGSGPSALGSWSGTPFASLCRDFTKLQVT